MITYCLITRYREYINWITFLEPYVDKFIIYNKGTDNDLFKDLIPGDVLLNKLEIVQSPNVGRANHTLAHYIVNNWESLPDVLVSLPGSVLLSTKKGKFFNDLKKNIEHINRFRGFYTPRFLKVGRTYNCSFDSYLPSTNCNKNGNELIKSEYPDFQSWKKALVDSRDMHYISMRTMLVVAKANIKHIDISIYQRILSSVQIGDNTENCLFAERIWAHLFRQHSFDSYQTIPKDSD